MKSVGIFYFSGTGNTELVAKMAEHEFKERMVSVDLIRMEDVLKKKCTVDFGKYDLIGIGCQVIGFGVPKIPRDFLKLLPTGRGKKAFVFRTAGGVAPVNYNASNVILRVLKRKGYEAFYERVFAISSNWVMKFEDEVVKQLFGATSKKVRLMCEDVLKGEGRILKTSLFLKLKMELVSYFSRPLFRVVGKDFRINESCNSCGKCIKECPAGNIKRSKDKLCFGLSCNSCLRCVYSCPQKAIDLRIFRFFLVKDGYDLTETLGRPVSLSEKNVGKEPAFFREYITNDSL